MSLTLALVVEIRFSVTYDIVHATEIGDQIKTLSIEFKKTCWTNMKFETT